MKKFFTALMLVISAFLTLAVFSAPALAQDQGGGDDGSAFGDVVDGVVNTVTWTFSGEDGDDNPEKSLQQWKDAFSSPGSCWGCELYSAMATVTLDIGSRGEQIFASGAIAAMNAFMGLWVVWQLYLLASPSHANGPSQTIDTIFQRLVLMMIVLFILSVGSFSFIMEGYVLPTIDGVMAAARSILGGAFQNCGGGGGNQLASAGSSLICSMHQEMGKGMGLGAFLIDDAELNPFPGGNFELFQLIGGLIIFVCFAWMMVMLPFRLFDAMIRIAVVSVILPVVVLAYQFKPTRGACKQAATSVLAAGLTFLFTSVAVAIAVQLLSIVASPVINAVTQDNNANGYVGPLGAKEFMVLVAAACGMAAFIKQAGTIAAEFSGFQGSMGNVGNGGGTAIAGAAGAAAGAAGYAGMRGAAALGGGARAGGQSLGKAISSARSGGAKGASGEIAPGSAGMAR